MSTTSHAPAVATESTRPLLWARLGSLVSFLPLGVWTVNHLWDNLSAFRGAQSWEGAVTAYPHPMGHWLTMAFVLVPLAIHTVWGIQRLFSFTPRNSAYKPVANARYWLQRISGAGVLAFIGAHLWLAMIHPRLVKGHPETFADIAGHMHFHVPTLLVYVLGTAGVSYHLANGISTFAWTWGLVGGRRSTARIDWIAGVSLVVLLAMSWGIIFALYQAGANHPLAE